MLENIVELTTTARNQSPVVFGISIAITVLTRVLFVSNAPIFEPFLGKVNPLLALLTVILLEIILLAFLQVRGRFVIYKAGNFKGIRVQRQVHRVHKQGLVVRPPKTRSGKRTIQLGEKNIRYSSFPLWQTTIG